VDAYYPDADDIAIARADHPMVPNKDGVYYFEITIVNGGNGSRYVVCNLAFRRIFDGGGVQIV
jgi:hypothetical protein